MYHQTLLRYLIGYFLAIIEPANLLKTFPLQQIDSPAVGFSPLPGKTFVAEASINPGC